MKNRTINKTILMALCLGVFMFGSFNANAGDRLRFGIKGGINTSNSSFKDFRNNYSSDTYTGFHAGITANIKLLMGFSIQPELVFSQTGLSYTIPTSDIVGNLLNDTDYSALYKEGNLELPINIQWGISLGPLRAFVSATPYVAYSLSNNLTINGIINEVSSELHDGDIGDSETFQYGMGLGFGVDVWRLQVSYKYKWDFNPIVSSNQDAIANLWLGDNTKIKGSEVSVVLFF